MSGYLYILIEREFIKSGEQTVKIGRKKCISNNFSNYPKGTLVLGFGYVQNHINSEKRLIKHFDKRFKNMTQYGEKYYNGYVEDMKMDFYLFLSKLSSECYYKHISKQISQIIYETSCDEDEDEKVES